MIDSLRVGRRSFPPGRIFCIGKNYPEHIRELRDEPPGEPVVFLKPATSLVAPGKTILIPSHGKTLHHEVEVVVLIGKTGTAIAEARALSHVAGVTLGVDLTLRDVQSRLRQRGLPWELSKAFEQSAPVGDFTGWNRRIDLADLEFICRVNGEIRQQGHTKDMIYSIPTLIHWLSGVWSLQPGDLIFTGTPAGVGPLRAGDLLSVSCDSLGRFEWTLE